MDLKTLAAGEPSFKTPAHEVVDLVSDDGSATEDVQAPITEVCDDEPQSDDEEEVEPSDSFSLLEDVLEEMGDEHLFNGGRWQYHIYLPRMV